MAKKKLMTWIARPTKPRKSSIPESLKAQMNAKAKELVETVLRHTGKWVVLYECLSLDECLTAIQNDFWFQT
jgi:hypothetical protein